MFSILAALAPTTRAAEPTIHRELGLNALLVAGRQPRRRGAL